MSNMVIDERTIQRLVDNCLTESERTAVLFAAERDPEVWRRLALAFIEEQVWQGAIPQAMNSLSRDRAKGVVSNKSRASSGSTLYRSPWMLALATLVLVGVTIGVRMLVDPPSSGSADGIAPAGSQVVNDEPVFLDFGGEQVPLYESTDPIREYMANTADRKMIEEFWHNGLEVEPDTRYISGTAPDGRSFVVPVRQYRLRPRFQ